MSFTVHNWKPGLNSAGSYMVSGRPYLTGSNIDGSDPNNGEICLEFPSVTKSFTVVNRTSENLLIHFDSRVNPDVIDQHHYMTLPNQDDSYGFDIKCRKVYISMESTGSVGEFELHAELTGIAKEDMHDLSGSGINTY